MASPAHVVTWPDVRRKCAEEFPGTGGLGAYGILGFPSWVLLLRGGFVAPPPGSWCSTSPAAVMEDAHILKHYLSKANVIPKLTHLLTLFTWARINMKVSFQKHLILKFPAVYYLLGPICVGPYASLYEDLIKYGWPEDIWFHVDKLSSAHVYLRLHKLILLDSVFSSGDHVVVPFSQTHVILLLRQGQMFPVIRGFGKGEKIEGIPKEVLMDCAHLVKANSIQDGSSATYKRTKN
ncbi:hypothetical protein HPG69_006698 [Diceros bicornis minor]|uniref:Coiled-coil domain-containing protein 25 n=1 Tax=Diceros bicornis minor TaxID=77932 RepID=A0A7J7F6F2_DICBM|nr:hypothetical protein HPG69_006698 [Diceros bicornis minor]